MLLPHQDLVDQFMPFNSTHPTRGGTNAGTVKILPHWPDTCPKLSAVRINWCIKVAKENHVYFSCKKAVRRKHRVDNCRRHQKCTKTENGRECMHFHHPLVHKSTAVEVGVV